MFSQMIQQQERNSQQLKQASKEAIQNKDRKYCKSNQKLMVYQVVTSRQKIITDMSSEANKLSKRVLGVHVNAVNDDFNSNLRAYSYLLICAMHEESSGQYTLTLINEKLKILKQNPPLVTNYPIHEKFKPAQMLQIFAAMMSKINELIECKLSPSEIIKFYNCYLDLTTFFLRSLLTNMKMSNSDNWLAKLPTSQVYSILSDYLDFQCVMNRNVYLFPDLKIFIASPDDKEFVFGKYYQNVDELKSNQSEIRQSTMQHIAQGNERCGNMRISNINLDVTMSQFMYPEKLADLQAPFSSKAPTPQFGQNPYKGFQQLLGYSSEEQALKQNNVKVQKNEKDTKPGSHQNFPFESEPEPEISDDNLKQTIKLYRQSVFTKKTFNDQIMTPSTHNKNPIGSAFCLHQFDFYHKVNQLNDQNNQKFCSQRVLLKGSSMVQQGQHFLNQVGERKKQIQNQLFDKSRDRRKNMQNLHGSIESNIIIDRKSRNPSPKSQNAKSQGIFEQRSNNSDISKKSNNKMALASDVYHLSIETKQGPKIKIQRNENSRSNSKNKVSYFKGPSIQNESSRRSNIGSHITINTTSKPELPKLQKNIYRPPLYRGSETPQSSISSPMGYNQNHIHIHIHNQNHVTKGKNKKGQIGVYSPKGEKQSRDNEIHYSIKDKNLQTAFESAIPSIIQQIQARNYEKLPKNNSLANTQSKWRTHQNNKQRNDRKANSPKFDNFASYFTGNQSTKSYKPNTQNQQQQKQSTFKLKKRKSQDGFQTIYAGLQKNNRQENTKGLVHIPSFLRNKQKIKTEITIQNAERLEKSLKRQHSKSIKITSHLSTKDLGCSNSSSPHVKSKIGQKISSEIKKFNQTLQLNIKGQFVGECKIDLKTPSFGTPEERKSKNRSARHRN